MKELSLFACLQKLLLADKDLPGLETDLPPGSAAPQQLSRITCHLLALGSELRAEVPDPQGFVRIAAAAASQAALLAAPWEIDPGDAIDQLAAHQEARLSSCSRGGWLGWRRRSPEVHLARAFWQLSGIALEVMTGNWADGLLEEHSADLANYLLFAACSSGAWDLAFQPLSHRETRRRSSGVGKAPARRWPGLDFPIPEFPGLGTLKGGRR